MKAAHRKELERNELANRIGRLASDIRKPMPRSMWFVLIGVVVVLIVGWILWRAHVLNRVETSQRWAEFDDGYNEVVMNLIKDYPTENVGKAASFQYNWIRTWDLGIKKLAADPKSALKSLKDAEESYLALAEACKGDPVWEPEALYALAIIEETRAVNGLKHLNTARDMYVQLAEKHPKAAHGELAKERAAKLKEGSETRKKVDEFYRELQFSLPQLRIKDR